MRAALVPDGVGVERVNFGRRAARMTLSLARVFSEFRGRDLRTAVRPAVRPSRPDRARTRTGASILGEALFKDAVVRQGKRADRYDTPFAVLLVDRGRNSGERDLWNPVLRAVAAVKRDVDSVGWFEQGEVLGLLLPDASGTGALKVTERLRRQLARRIGDAALAGLSIRLYAHGDRSGLEGDTLSPVDLLVEAFLQQRRSHWREAAKRGFDVVGSLGLLALFAPVLLAVCAVVKWTSPGPVFYPQVRVGRRGEPFTMLKFRTMYVNAGHAVHQDYVNWFITSSGRQPRTGNEVFKLTNDPRITPAGRFLRKTSLDELPQFWNVLWGDMSLVGPRPPLPFEVERYQPWHRRRLLEAKPGVTGLWQVEGRSRTTFDEMVRLDLRYARTHSLWTDIKILAATPRAMVSGRGAC
jgi:lipopolysaccharide/colanic/teichoic acid biosynthesis glycosyltransferase